MLDISRQLYSPLKRRKKDEVPQISLEEKVKLLEQEVFNTHSQNILLNPIREHT